MSTEAARHYQTTQNNQNLTAGNGDPLEKDFSNGMYRSSMRIVSASVDTDKEKPTISTTTWMPTMR